MDLDYRIGKILQVARKNMGITQDEAALSLSVSITTIGNWERGKIGTLHNLRLYAEALGFFSYEIEAIAHQAPVNSFSPEARALNILYWRTHR